MREAVGLALTIGRRIERAGVNLEKVNREEWAQIFRNQIDELIKENIKLQERVEDLLDPEERHFG